MFWHEKKRKKALLLALSTLALQALPVRRRCCYSAIFFGARKKKEKALLLALSTLSIALQQRILIKGECAAAIALLVYAPRTQFACFTGTKVQILTQTARLL